jgi:hypothetical protein
MAIERHPVELASGAHGASHGVFILDEEDDEDLCHLSFEYPGGEITAEESDYFEAMCQIRLRLEMVGWRPICYGSSKCVYPSGMCRDMGRGLKAYKLRFGHPAGLDDLVGICETGPDIEPSSVAEQRQFFNHWVQSIGGSE